MKDPFDQEYPLAPDSNWGDIDAYDKQEDLDYDPESETYRVSFERETESVAMAVVWAVGVVSETEPTELPPLYSVCDPEKLEKVIQPPIDEPSNGDICITFVYVGHTVTVHNHGFVGVKPPQPDE